MLSDRSTLFQVQVDAPDFQKMLILDVPGVLWPLHGKLFLSQWLWDKDRQRRKQIHNEKLFFFKADSAQLKSIYRTHLKTTTVDQSAVQPKITKALNIFYLFQKLIIYQAILYCLEYALNIYNIHNIRTAILTVELLRKILNINKNQISLQQRDSYLPVLQRKKTEQNS